MTALITPDFRDLFARGFDAIAAAEKESWHAVEYTDDGVPYVHASGVHGCPRKYVLAGIGEATDGNTVDSHVNFAFGHSLHKNLENAFNLVPDFDGWTALFAEQGGTHTKMPLKGKPDAILMSPAKQPVLFDLKSEAASGKIMRQKAMKQSHAEHAARPEHMIQITAGAMIAEDVGLVNERVDVGMVLYVSRQTAKNKWDFDTILFEITKEMRNEVERAVEHKVAAWHKYKRTGELPQRLPDELWFGKMTPPWMCRPRGEDDCRGLYCEARFACMEKHV